MYDILFYAYVLFVAPFLAGAIGEALKAPELRLVPGLIILGAVVCESIALPVRFAMWGSGRKDDTHGVPLALGSTVSICHIILSYFLCMYMLDSFGVMGTEEMSVLQNWVLGTVMVLVFARETWLFIAAGMAMRAKKAPSRRQTIMSDILLLAFQCIAYTTYWDVMFGSEAVRGLHWVATVFLAGGLILVFYILYLPMRMADVLGTYYIEGPVAGRRAARIMFAGGAFLGAYPVLAGIALALLGR